MCLSCKVSRMSRLILSCIFSRASIVASVLSCLHNLRNFMFVPEVPVYAVGLQLHSIFCLFIRLILYCFDVISSSKILGSHGR
jgi:hypothetical protein